MARTRLISMLALSLTLVALPPAQLLAQEGTNAASSAMEAAEPDTATTDESRSSDFRDEALSNPVQEPLDSEPDETATSTPSTETSDGHWKSDVESRLAELEGFRQGQEIREFEKERAKSNERSLDVYGFFDVNFAWMQADEGSVLQGSIVENPSFLINRLNLFFRSNLSESLEFVTELRFTFLPNGNQKMDESNFTFERQHMAVVDAFTTETVELGGIIIERAQLTWRILPKLRITAGRFLTPFGIWNVDHGSPVIIPIRPPYLMITQAVPLAQTGLLIEGDLGIGRNSTLGYGLTLGNGRGSTESVFDQDASKAVGLKTQFSFRKQDLRLEFGGYGYYGRITRNGLKLASVNPIELETEQISTGHELTGTVNLLLQIKGLRIQTEGYYGYIAYEKNPPVSVPVLNYESPLYGYQPDFIKMGGYALVSYTFSPEIGGSIIELTPFLAMEYDSPDDNIEEYALRLHRVGLNMKPSPFVTCKVEVDYLEFIDPVPGLQWLWVTTAQLAVSF